MDKIQEFDLGPKYNRQGCKMHGSNQKHAVRAYPRRTHGQAKRELKLQRR